MVKRSKKNNKRSRKFKINGGGDICKEIEIISDYWRKDPSPNMAMFHDNGDLLATVNWDAGKVELWNMSEELSPSYPVSHWRPHNYRLDTMIFKGKENLLYTTPIGKHEIKIWSFNQSGSNFKLVDTFRPPHPFDGVRGITLMCFTVHPILPLLLIGGGDDLSILYSLNPDGSFKNVLSLINGHEEGVSDVAFHPKMPYLVSAGLNGQIYLGCLKSDGSELISITPFDEHNSNNTNRVVFHPYDYIVCTSNSNGIKLWKFSPDCSIIECILTQDIGNIRSINFHPSGNFLMTCEEHKTQLWRLIFQKEGCSLHLSQTFDEYTEGYGSVSFHPNGKVLFMNDYIRYDTSPIGGLYKSAKLWDCTRLSTEWQKEQALKQGLTKTVVKKLAEKSRPGWISESIPQNHMLSRTGNVDDLTYNRGYKQHIRSVLYQGVGQRAEIDEAEEPMEETTLEPMDEPKGSTMEEVDGGSRSRRKYKKKLSRRIRRFNN